MLYDVEIAKANKNNIGRCTSPLISILVLTYNNSKYIYALLDSISVSYTHLENTTVITNMTKRGFNILHR